MTWSAIYNGYTSGTVCIPPANPRSESVDLGVREDSVTIDASAFFGEDSWRFAVQAHGPGLAHQPNTVENGQLLLMLPSKASRSRG